MFHRSFSFVGYCCVGEGGHRCLRPVTSSFLRTTLLSHFFPLLQSDLAFGPKGRPASAGKPRINGDQTITFEVEMVGLPGREEELIELIGDV